MDAVPREWLETDGRGGFASGTADLVRTRRYHALLLSSGDRSAGRFALVNGLEVWAETPSGRVPLSSQLYGGEVLHPDGVSRISAFEWEPWPRWTFRDGDGSTIEQELFVSRGSGATCLFWRAGAKADAVTLAVRPLLSGRDYHALHRENPAFRFDPEEQDGLLIWRPYPGVPPIAVASNGEYSHEPVWYRNFLYTEERARGLDCLEDLASPGWFRFDLSSAEAVLVLRAGEPVDWGRDAVAAARAMRRSETRRRRGFASRLERSADDFTVARGQGKTIIAGYPWFTDWGRDAFVSLRGLCLSTGRLREAREILLEWAGAVSEGMLPNRFSDRGEEPEYNSVDASLWFIVAVFELVQAARRRRTRLPVQARKELFAAVDRILAGYTKGTRYGIRADADGLLAAGERGIQLTWMDAKVGDRVVTPRIGKPVEVEALWVNALRIGERISVEPERSRNLAALAAESFERRFWNEEAGCLFDVVDCDHVAGTADSSLRPNQIFAVGGLPFPLVSGERAEKIVDAVDRHLRTPSGLRTLDPRSPAYVGHYEGGPALRDRAYHQGTAWPWLMGAFVEAWVRVRGDDEATRREARERFLEPLFSQLDRAGLGHISELADGDPPHTPRGAPFQAWSLAEAIRLDRLLSPETAEGEPRPENGRTT